MTTVDPTIAIGLLQDRESLQLVSRILESQTVMLEAQLTQARQLQEAVQGRLRNVK